MTAAIALLLLGFTLIYTALTGQSLADVLSGKGSVSLNPKGGQGGSGGQSASGDTPPDAATGTDPKGQFKGPNAATLRRFADIATSEYHLRITQVCRPKSATYGAPNSLHKECRAFDAVGSTQDKVAFARYVKGVCAACEVFCDQAGMSAPGYDHSDHVHVGF